MAKKKKNRLKRKYCAGNFRLPSPAAAKRFITKWEKLGVPAAGVDGLKTEKDVKIAKIRLKQAELIQEAFQKRVDAYAANRKAWADCKGASKTLKECVGPAIAGKLIAKPDHESHANKGCGGNFRVPSKKNSKNYLKRFFKQFRTDISKFAPDATGAFKIHVSEKGSKADGFFGQRKANANFIQKIQTAVEVVGVAEAAAIAQQAIKKSMEKAGTKLAEIAAKLNKPSASLTKAEEKLQKNVEAAKKRLAAKKASLETDKEKLEKYLANTGAAAVTKPAKKIAKPVAKVCSVCGATGDEPCLKGKVPKGHRSDNREVLGHDHPGRKRLVTSPRRRLRRRGR
jgi:DNA-binding transcriptional MerR regulator